MGNLNSGVRKYIVDFDFFKKWHSNMAYILGFTCADGNIHKSTLAWELTNKQKCNHDLLIAFSNVMKSSSFVEKRKSSFRLRINSAKIIGDLLDLGIIPNKKKVLEFPRVPEVYLKHFIRGFLDGDGWVVNSFRGKGSGEVCIGFSNGSLRFMQGLILSLKQYVGIVRFNLRERKKEIKAGEISLTYQMEFYAENARKILDYLFGDLSDSDLYLKRKYKKYLSSKQIFVRIDKSKRLGKRWVRLESGKGWDIADYLKKSMGGKSIIPRQMASNLGVSLSTLYRWLHKSGIREFSKRGSPDWSKRVINSRRIVTHV